MSASGSATAEETSGTAGAEKGHGGLPLPGPRRELGLLLGALLGGLAAAVAAAPDEPAVRLDEAQIRLARTLSPLPALPPDPTNRVADDPRAAALGQRLFFDRGLSRDGTISCASCHDPARAFSDGRALARGLADGTRNAPTLLNSAHNRWFFWDGRADSAWAQALQPLENEAEMGGDRRAIAARLAADPALAERYEALFGPLPEPGQAADHELAVLLANVGKALAAYQRRLLSGNAPFDRFVRGLTGGDPRDFAALSPSAQRGLALFLGPGDCRRCHGGPLFSDGEFHDIGLPPPPGAAPDPGRYAGARRVLADPFHARGEHSDERDGERALALATLAVPPTTWGEFKTPSLRNVAATAPYMHAGQLADLHAVVRFYATREGAARGHHGEQVLSPFPLDEQGQDDLVAFLESLTDFALDPALLAPP